jgi:hypothetical protein
LPWRWTAPGCAAEQGLHQRSFFSPARPMHGDLTRQVSQRGPQLFAPVRRHPRHSEGRPVCVVWIITNDVYRLVLEWRSRPGLVVPGCVSEQVLHLYIAVGDTVIRYCHWLSLAAIA